MSISGRITAGAAAAAHRLAAVVLPQTCFLCGGLAGDSLLCEPCRDTLPDLPAPRCPVCALPTPGGGSCGACLKAPPHFDATVARFRYGFPVDKLVQSLKYRHRLAIADFLARELARCSLPRVDAVVPLPLPPRRLRERGFNQAVEIARPLARRLAVPLLAQACRRPLESPPQASLPWQARRRNVRSGFECAVDLSGLSILAVDDVMTTGATLDEFARTLKKHGAARVINCVVARTLKD